MIESTAVIVALVIETAEQLGHSLPTVLLTISKLLTSTTYCWSCKALVIHWMHLRDLMAFEL